MTSSICWILQISHEFLAEPSSFISPSRIIAPLFRNLRWMEIVIHQIMLPYSQLFFSLHLSLYDSPHPCLHRTLSILYVACMLFAIKWILPIWLAQSVQDFKSSLTRILVPISSYLQCHIVPPRLVEIFLLISSTNECYVSLLIRQLPLQLGYT